jgi:hypothetical protein
MRLKLAASGRPAFADDESAGSRGDCSRSATGRQRVAKSPIP